MIGQVNLLNKFQELIKNNCLARTNILVGEKNSGRKTLIKEIAALVNYEVKIINKSVVEIREINIRELHKTIFIIDTEGININGQYALLKKLEEVNNNCFIFLLSENTQYLIQPILSRCVVFHMDKYSIDEIKSSVFGRIDVSTATNIYEARLLEKYGKDFIKFVELFKNNFYRVPLYNILKVENKINLTDCDDLYNLKLFLRVFIKCLKIDIFSSDLKLMIITLNTLSELNNVNGINKKQLFEIWLLKIREVYREEVI